MKRFYDVYITPTNGEFGLSNFAGFNLLDVWDKLELAEAGATLKSEPQTANLGDGTTLHESDKIEFSAGTLRVDKAEYAYLKSTFNNTLADVMLLDSSDPKLAIIVTGIRLHVTKIAETAGVAAIRISGSVEIPIAALGERYQVLDIEDIGYSGIVEGIVYAADGVTPVSDAEVIITDEDEVQWADYTDKDGRYMILAFPTDYEIIATKSGHTFPPAREITIRDNQTLNVNITAEEE